MGTFEEVNNEDNRADIKSPQAFYADCTTEFHKIALDHGFAGKGVIDIPELIPWGRQVAIAFLNDSFFKREFSENPTMYYYVIMSLCLQAGIVFADKWHSDREELHNEYVERIIAEGPANACAPLLKQFSLDDMDSENEYYMKIYSVWIKVMKPSWTLKDPTEYVVMAMLAAYQVGVSMILEKEGD